MSDTMLFGVLRMPYEMAMDSELSRRQFYFRAQEAADRLEKLATPAIKAAAVPAQAPVDPGIPAFNPNEKCSPMLTQCPRCNNPHHACDSNLGVAAPVEQVSALTDEQIWSAAVEWAGLESVPATRHGVTALVLRTPEEMSGLFRALLAASPKAEPVSPLTDSRQKIIVTDALEALGESNYYMVEMNLRALLAATPSPTKEST